VGKGQRVKATSPGAPALAGTVERLDDHSLVLLTENPGPGVALLGVHDCGGPFLASLSLYLYGEPAPAVVTRDEPAWRAWMDKHFPSAAGETGAATA
jgi:hypothetical protein